MKRAQRQLFNRRPRAARCAETAGRHRATSTCRALASGA
jgi:hypothetical protein